ncbi:type II toxin-antitoxin system RelE/ParE family toxin [Methylobacterium sp. P5_C11]
MRLRLTPQALADVETIATYLESRNPLGAQRVEAAIQDALILIGRYPEIGSIGRQRVRRLALPRYPYLIFYRVDEPADVIAILAIRHAARKPAGQS